MPSLIIWVSLSHFIAYWIVLASLPLALIYSITSGAKLCASFNFKHIKHVKYFLLSPMMTVCENMGKTVFNTFSMRTGATFSPPAVINNYLIRPVIANDPFFSMIPTSPECINPLLSTAFLVYYSFLKYPINTLRPMFIRYKYLLSKFIHFLIHQDYLLLIQDLVNFYLLL